MITDATGEYVTVLHSDDLYLEHALKHLYEVAEKTNADMVHEMFFLVSPPGGIINSINDCKLLCLDRNTFNNVKVMPNESVNRFIEWSQDGTFCDIQYNFFKRRFLLETLVCHGVLLDGFWDGPGLQIFCCLMNAKTFVKTPVICYIRRDAPDSVYNQKGAFQIERFIDSKIKMIRYLDYYLPKIKFFRDNTNARNFVKMKFIIGSNNHELFRHGVYKNGISNELYQKVETAFKKNFGNDYFFPMIFFHWVNSANQNINVLNNMFQNTLISFNANPAPPPSR